MPVQQFLKRVAQSRLIKSAAHAKCERFVVSAGSFLAELI